MTAENDRLKIEADRETEKAKVEAERMTAENERLKIEAAKAKLKLRRKLKWLKFRHSEKVKRKQDEMR